MFFAHPLGLKILRNNPNVVTLDYTYKTNCFKILFLYIVRVTSIGTSFNIGYAFIPREYKRNYKKVIGALAELFKELGIKPACFITNSKAALKIAFTKYFLEVP